MTLDEIILDMHDLENDLRSYERKYGVLSETFYQSYMNGEEPEDDAWVMDWTRWAGTYGVWLRRREQYHAALDALRVKAPSISDMIEKRSRYESIPVAA